tara:strand:+ start:218 stop:985 length:768 start_codon:yes stop_codon:yes gene_type:complete
VLIFLFFFTSCETKKEKGGVVFARVGNKTLTLQKLINQSSKETVDKSKVPVLVSNWIDNTVLLNKAIEKNLDKDSLLLKKRDSYFNNLVINAFLNQHLKRNIKISKNEILNYYEKNKFSFVRNSDELYLEHFLVQDLSSAKSIKDVLFLRKKNKEKINVLDFLIETKTIDKKRVSQQFLKLFLNKDSVIGPIKTDKGYHVFKILKRYKKDSIKGLDLVYDEIYQRLIKKEEKQRSVVFLDSLKNQYKIYINPKYQ